MLKQIAPLALTCVVALAACGGDEQTDASVERGAAASTSLTICVQNDSSRSISSTGDGSPSQPEGFLVRPGERACTTSAEGTEEIVQSMMSDEGPSWNTRFAFTGDDSTSGVSYLETTFATCGKTWTNKFSFTASISCSGNPFRISGEIENSTANITFADQ